MQVVASIFILMAGVLWGSQGIFAKDLSAAGLSIYNIAAIRISGCAIFILLAVLLLKRALLKIRLQDVWLFLGSGLISIVDFTCLYYQAIALSSMGTAAVLLYISPALVTLMSCLFFKEQITKRKILALACAICGCICVSGVLGSGMTVNVSGFACGIGAGFCYALYSIFSAAAMHRGYHPFTVMVYTFVIGSAGILPLADFGELQQVNAAVPGLYVQEILFVLVAALLPYLFYTIGLRSLDPSKAAIMASMEAVSAAIFGITVFDEPLSANIVIGIVAVLGSVIVLNLKVPQMSRVH
ncbi:MAG: DMT family transporter [Candidatus Anaerobiospirillum merdipullorum]|uniref:DMT family transporter n=1 Tax=Candidatus Anaerobiospirillum merdipullorum TaxID=2838450 RepID=A0A9E2NRK2_9GAMM|nr:DMT family transporter [Candidatus Anaerobiospirillum merdipullorum]